MSANRIALLLVAFAFLLPVMGRAQSVADLTAQVQALLSQLAALQARVGAPATQQSAAAPGLSSAACPVLSRSISLGSAGSDVLSLQQFLHAGALLDSAALDGVFRASTQLAVQQWQSLHGVVSGGDPSVTGFGVVGPRTRTAIALACGSAGISSAAGACPVARPPSTLCASGWRGNTDSNGCTISYSCVTSLPSSSASASGASACPTAVSLMCPAGTHEYVGADCSRSCAPGVADASSPTSVSFSVSVPSEGVPVTAAFIGSAPAETPSTAYFIDFGDGTPYANYASMAWSAGGCTGGGGCRSSLAATHVYASVGTYTARLLYTGVACTSFPCPASPDSSARVAGTVQAVVGPTAASTGGSLGNQSSLFAPSQTSGSVPLTITFTTSYASGAYVDFGDGSSGDVQSLGCNSAGSCVYGAAHTYTTPGSYTPHLVNSVTHAPISWLTLTLSSAGSAASLTVSPSNTGSANPGSTITFVWQSQNAPAGSAVGLWLASATTSAVYGLIAGGLPVSGTYVWTVPSPRCDSQGNCHYVSDGPYVHYADPGSYKIVGKLYSPSNAYLGGYLSGSAPTYPTYHVSYDTPLFIIGSQ